MTTARYIVYVNDPNNKSVGHVETCPHAKVWGGATTAAGGWGGPFGSKDEAEAFGKLSGNPFHCVATAVETLRCQPGQPGEPVPQRFEGVVSVVECRRLATEL